MGKRLSKTLKKNPQQNLRSSDSKSSDTQINLLYANSEKLTIYINIVTHVHTLLVSSSHLTREEEMC